jgi:spore coat polysaccharide biosynthesis protein SpsF (cytidylyltransferase family)
MIALLITARVGSSRLAEKHLIPAKGKPLLYWLIKRFETEFSNEIAEKKACIAIATSERPENKKFSIVTEGTSCQVIPGSDENIPLRHLQCAKQLNATHVISIDGDDILCSFRAAKVLYGQMIKDTKHDLFTAVGLPLGMNLSGYTVKYLEKSLNEQSNKKLETGWGRILRDPQTWTLTLGKYDIMGDLRFTLDYKEDAEFFCKIIESLKEKVITITDANLVSFVEQNSLQRINAGLKEIYWKNYNAEKDKELNEEQ